MVKGSLIVIPCLGLKASTLFSLKNTLFDCFGLESEKILLNLSLILCTLLLLAAIYRFLGKILVVFLDFSSISLVFCLREKYPCV